MQKASLPFTTGTLSRKVLILNQIYAFYSKGSPLWRLIRKLSSLGSNCWAILMEQLARIAFLATLKWSTSNVNLLAPSTTNTSAADTYV